MLRLALALLFCAAPTLAQPVDETGPSSAGMGDLGAAVQAGNRDCPLRGATDRVLDAQSTPGAVSCAPTGAGPGNGLTPVPPHPPVMNKSSPDTRETPGHSGQ